MAIDTKPAPDSSVTELVSGIIHDAQDLITQQFEMLKVELLNEFRKTRDAGLMMALGAGLGLIGVLLLFFMVVYLLNAMFPALPLWASFAICGGVTLAAGMALVFAGKQKIAHITPVPEQSVEALKENMRWITKPK